MIKLLLKTDAINLYQFFLQFASMRVAIDTLFLSVKVPMEMFCSGAPMVVFSNWNKHAEDSAEAIFVFCPKNQSNMNSSVMK